MTWRKRDVAVMVGLIVVYLAATAGLAITVDRRFFINDGVSLAVWVLMGLMLAFAGAEVSRSR